MIKNAYAYPDSHKSTWLAKPTDDHLVQFYSSDDDLLAPLALYISEGIQRGDTCVVVATQAHREKLDIRLQNMGINLPSIKQRGQYIPLDAHDTLDSFMVDGSPDSQKFTAVVGELIAKAMQRGKPIRAYGEMVAILWQLGNQHGMLELEALWNKLARQYDFALYCAYPELHFIMDEDVRVEIDKTHTLSFMELSLS